MRKTTLLLAGCATLMSFSALAQDGRTQFARANFLNAAGESIGIAELTQGEDGVTISGELSGIAPGQHGFHVHETGDCDPATQFESAGAHFNPENHQHGLENPAGPHAGDMTNQTAGDDGMLTLDQTTPLISLTEGHEGYVFDEDGSALVLHAQADDQKTDPSGNSGDRIACGVIEAAN